MTIDFYTWIDLLKTADGNTALDLVEMLQNGKVMNIPIPTSSGGHP